MCIPHGAVGGKSNGFIKEDKPKKHIKRISDAKFEKGDPDFIDERTSHYQPKKKESIFASFFN